jgi:hypothetical protein
MQSINGNAMPLWIIVMALLAALLFYICETKEDIQLRLFEND